MLFLILSFAITVAMVLGAVTGLIVVLGKVGLPVWLASTLACLVGLAACLPIFWLVSWLLCPLTRLETRISNRFDSKQVKAAKEAFRNEHPNQEPFEARCIAEETRWVISLLYGGGRPPRVIFYVVDRVSYVAKRLIDDSAYAPKHWR